MRAWLKLNGIRSVIKLRPLNKGEHLERVAEEVFALRCFYNGYENLIEMPKFASRKVIDFG